MKHLKYSLLLTLSLSSAVMAMDHDEDTSSAAGGAGVATSMPVESARKDATPTISIATVNMSNPEDVAKLNLFLDEMRVKRDAAVAHLAPTLDKMVDWFKAEYGENCSPKILSSSLHLKLLSEATFWSHHLPLKGFLNAMTSFDQVQAFKPLEEMHFKKTPLGAAVEEVTCKMVAPSIPQEASWALQQAAWVMYKKRIGADAFAREEAAYDAKTKLA